MMNGKVKRNETLTEEDISLLLRRYRPTTILTLLHEVSQVGGWKIDWKAQVKKTSTGITSPREYQSLWRHLAYHNPLMEELDDDVEPLDCESDLDFELEASPNVSVEASTEATACVKVLMSSNTSHDASNRPTVVAPLTINIPYVQASQSSADKHHQSCSSRGLNITIPVSVHKQSLPATLPVDGNVKTGPSSSRPPAKKKRKLWTKEEDTSLINAVQKFGEGNWQNASKEDLKHGRTASQLPQATSSPRFSSLRKQGGKSTGSPNDLTEAQLSTRQAISMALNMPMIGSLSAICSGKASRGAGTTSTMPVTSTNPAGPSEPSDAIPPLSQKVSNQSQQVASQGVQKGGNNSANRSQVNQVKLSGPVKHITGPNTLIQKAAFAAGGRIATPSTAASLFKAAQSKNAVHIRPGVSLAMTTIPGAKPSIAAVVPRPSSISQIRTQPPTNSLALHSVSGLGNQIPIASSQHMEHKMAGSVPEEAEGNSEHKKATVIQTNSHLMVSKGGASVPTSQQRKAAIGQTQVPVVNLDEGDDMDVVVEGSSPPRNCERHQGNDLYARQDQTNNTCAAAVKRSPSNLNDPFTTKIIGVVRHGYSEPGFANNKPLNDTNGCKRRNGDDKDKADVKPT